MQFMRQTNFFPTLFTLLCLTACAFTTPASLTVFPTPTTIRVIQTTLVPTIERQLHTVATPEPELTPEPDVDRCSAESERASATYTVEAEIDYASRRIIVNQQIDYINRSSTTLAQLVFSVKPNNWPDIFTLKNVTLSTDERLNYELTGQRLTVDLPEPLETDCRVKLRLDFDLIVPPIDIGGPNAYRGYLGYSERQFNLGHWLPVAAPRLNDDWTLREENRIGEQDVLAEADWDVTIEMKNAPDNLLIAAPGAIEEGERGQWHFTLSNARDFSLSLSDQFARTKREADNGTLVELYTFDDALIQADSGVIDSSAFALDAAVSSLGMYADLYGAYPYERLVIVQSDFPDGMEFSGIVFVGGEYFRNFGGPTSYLMLITIHEIAHQWWYNRVGNDPAVNPWLDEALATYSEYVFIEEFYPALREWWWSFRVDNFSPEGFVDSTVYDFTTRREYINAVYLRGVRMLKDLRDTLGTDAFFNWLRRYADAGAGQIVTPDFFWSLLTPAQFDLTAPIRERYLKQPQIIYIQPEGE